MRRPARWPLTALLTLAAVALPLTPVAGQSPAAPGASPSSPAASPVAADPRLVDAVAATVAIDTVRTAFSVVFSDSSLIPDGTSISGSGQTNLGPERRMRLDMDMTDLGAGRFELIVDGPTLYLRGVELGDVPADQWISADLTSDDPAVAPLRSLASGNNDASLLLYFLLGATAPAQDLGSEEIDGVATTHLRTTIDLDRALALVPDEMRDTLAANIAEVRAGGVAPVLAADVWVDASDLVHRVTFWYTLGELMGEGTMAVTFDFREHGAPLDLDIPPADQVVELSSLFE